MKIIEQSHKILSYDDISMLETAGRTCYQSEPKGCNLHLAETCIQGQHRDYRKNCNHTDCKHNSSQKFIKMLLDRGHHAMIEFGDLTVKFITNRGVTHELVRHRMCSFAQESTRYVKYDGHMEFIRPVWFTSVDPTKCIESMNKEMRASLTWAFSMEDAEMRYRQLLHDGWRPEQAREVLPNSLKTEIVVKANFREWRHILKLRCSKTAHPQMRALMLPLLKELKTKIPVIFDDLDY